MLLCVLSVTDAHACVRLCVTEGQRGVCGLRGSNLMSDRSVCLFIIVTQKRAATPPGLCCVWSCSLCFIWSSIQIIGYLSKEGIILSLWNSCMPLYAMPVWEYSRLVHCSVTFAPCRSGKLQGVSWECLGQMIRIAPSALYLAPWYQAPFNLSQ